MQSNQRLTASLDGEFVVFLIGMRVNQPLRVDKWFPVVAAMTRMIGELRVQPHLGLLHAEMWTSRTSIMVQYWRSMEKLIEGFGAVARAAVALERLRRPRASNITAGR